MLAPREIHDYSAIDDFLAVRSTRANSDRRLKTGLGVLAGGIGVGAVLAAGSLWVRPEIIETTRVVTETKIEKVEVPKIVTETKIVEVPKLVQVPTPPAQPAPTPAPPAAAPKVGDKSNDQSFTQSDEFRAATYKGKVQSFVNGRVTFEGGKIFYVTNHDGSRNTSTTTDRFNGDNAFCSDTLQKFPTGGPIWECRVLHRGVVENLFAARNDAPKPAPSTDGDILEELFQ